MGYEATVQNALSMASCVKTGLLEFDKLHGDMTKDEVESIPTTRSALLEHKHVRQSWFTRFVSSFSWHRLFAASSQCQRARLHSLSSKGAQAWMQATPEKGLRMSSLSVLVACRRALGLSLPFRSTLPQTKCPTCAGHGDRCRLSPVSV
jgi:hypothetical protein